MCDGKNTNTEIGVRYVSIGNAIAQLSLYEYIRIGNAM